MKTCIYNLFPPLLGHISNWYKHIDRIKYMGFEWIYINPITYPGFSGSLYAAKDYYKYNENFFSSAEANIAEKELKELYKQIEEETKPVIKKKFDYDIPIAKIDDAGITTTGAASEGNQLPQLLSEYSAYRTQNNLWTIINNEVTYAMNTDGKYYRCLNGQEVVLNEQ